MPSASTLAVCILLARKSVISRCLTRFAALFARRSSIVKAFPVINAEQHVHGKVHQLTAVRPSVGENSPLPGHCLYCDDGGRPRRVQCDTRGDRKATSCYPSNKLIRPPPDIAEGLLVLLTLHLSITLLSDRLRASLATLKMDRVALLARLVPAVMPSQI